MVPNYVKLYWDAQMWQLFYFGMPLLCIALIVFVVARWQEYREDCSVNDDTPRKNQPGKTLGL